jgi:hypothetical protein
MSDPELSPIERLAAIIHDDGVDVNKLSTPELRAYIEKQGVDLKAAEARFAKFLKAFEGRHRLELAAQKRKEELARPSPVSKIIAQGSIALQEGLEEARFRVKALFEKMQVLRGDKVELFARDFEKATLEDLLSMEEDLRAIEENEARNK